MVLGLGPLPEMTWPGPGQEGWEEVDLEEGGAAKAVPQVSASPQ